MAICQWDSKSTVWAAGVSSLLWWKVLEERKKFSMSTTTNTVTPRCALCCPRWIVLLIHWVGGVHTEIRLPRRRRGQRTSTSADVIAAVRQLVLIANDDLIAGILNRNGLATGYGNRWTRERVTSLRSHHGIAVYKPADDGNRTVA